MEPFPYAFLSFLETREQRLLAWGFYDISFTPIEMYSLLQTEGSPELQQQWADLKSDGWSMADFVDEMAHANLMYIVDSSQNRFRTRFAETVRLTARLKQMFSEDQWPTAPNLVSDIKIHLKPRKYPKRNQPAEECWHEVKDFATKPKFQKQIFEKLAENVSEGGLFEFSSFQKRAFSHLLSKYDSPGFSGSVICAGTGAGKTKAFYVPAILGAATELNEEPFTKIIAIYPRNVLLADQFREALSEVMKLNSVLGECGARPFRLGALLGETPYQRAFSTVDTRSGKLQIEKFNKWRRIGRSGDFVIPYLKSPLDPDAELVWKEQDRKAGRTCLYRADGRNPLPDVPDGLLSLTREDLMASPPDILFLSLEMLNRELGNPKWSKTFGIRKRKLTPRFLLLDEVHSYEGIQGAQVAWVLRRWRHATKSNRLHVVGLSATLKQAPEHLSRVTAVKASEILEFRPREDAQQEESIEYNIAVKGDPAAGTSLLSTSIQCGMLLARTLTPRNHIPASYGLPIEPEKLFKKKVFGFTDNLDVVNRWLSDMANAEQRRLARFRLNPLNRIPQPNPMPGGAELDRRNELGQIWDLPRRLGFDLSVPLQVGRCSSQDPGLESNDDLVIATSSLEVGFDDPQVAAVMQHKRPMSIASFIQRKGRAGRTRGSRPWTMVVLSDYGADRFAFQQAERLFEPELDELNLPYQNQYVLRIQASYFLIDWIGRRVGKDAPFSFLRRPSGGYAATKAMQTRTVQILEDFLRQGVEWKAFRQDAIKLFSNLSGPSTWLTEHQVDSLFWELPRPLLRQVVPCLLRKLEQQWRFADIRLGDRIEDRGISYPLPEFLPIATFAELDISETRISFQTQNNFAKDDEFMDVSQVLVESCPARASKRFSTRARDPGFWHDFSTSLGDGPNQVAARTLYPNALDLGTFDGVRVFQPDAVNVSHCPRDVLDSSYGSWNWASSFSPFGKGYEVPVFSIEPWKDVIESSRAYLHRDQSGIDVTRFARSFDFEIRYERGRVSIGTGILADDVGDEIRPEGVGFQRRVDGIEIKIKRSHINCIPDLPPNLMARFRSDYFLHVLKESNAFPVEINGFLKEWIWQTSLAMLTATSLNNNCSLENAQQLLDGNRLASAERVISSIFHVRDPNLHGQEGRLVENLRDFWRNEQLVNELKSIESLLWQPLGVDFQNWVRQRYVATIAQAFRMTTVSTDLEINENDLLVDVIESNQEIAIFLTEKQSGGLGVIEKIVQRLSTDPNRFHNGMRFVLGHCHRDKTTDYLRSVVEEAQQNANIASAFSGVRNTKGFTEQERAKSKLQETLVCDGFDATREKFVSLMSRILKPGSSHQTDGLIHSINNDWHSAEATLQVGIDSRVYAYSALQDANFNNGIRAHFQQLHGQALPSDAQLYNATERFLLPVCKDSCQECLQYFNRFNDFGIPSRELASLWLDLVTPTIKVASANDDWQVELESTIKIGGLVTVEFPATIAADMLPRLNRMFANEIEVGVLFHPVSIQRIEKNGRLWNVTLQLKDLIHG
jgi:superfamily II DNA or RNA helicase